MLNTQHGHVIVNSLFTIAQVLEDKTYSQELEIGNLFLHSHNKKLLKAFHSYYFKTQKSQINNLKHYSQHPPGKCTLDTDNSDNS